MTCIPKTQWSFDVIGHPALHPEPEAKRLKTQHEFTNNNSQLITSELESKTVATNDSSNTDSLKVSWSKLMIINNLACLIGKLLFEGCVS